MNGNEPTGMPLTSEPESPTIEALLKRLSTTTDPDVLALIVEYVRLREMFHRVEQAAIEEQWMIDDLTERLAIIADYADFEEEFELEEENEDDEPIV